MSSKDNFFEQFNGRGLFVFSDPGGAKPVLAFVGFVKSRLDDYRIISDRQYAFYADFKETVQEDTGAEKELQDFRPGFVFTGTSYTSAIELRYIKKANELGIGTYAFVDHRTFIKERFTAGGETIYPGKILVVDEESKNAAVDAGIDEGKIMVITNPYHDFLQSWKPALSKEQFFKSINIDPGKKKLIVYAPDPLSNVNGIGQYGFDEVTATEKINALLASVQQDYLVCLTPHPNQNTDLFKAIETNNITILPKGADVNSLMYYADVVVGFFSNFLKEAAVMNKKVIRFIGSEAKNDPFENIGIGVVTDESNFLNKITA